MNRFFQVESETLTFGSLLISVQGIEVTWPILRVCVGIPPCVSVLIKFPSQPLYYSQITYYWTGLLISDPSYLVGNLTNSKIAERKALEPLKS
jgi:hypothetical protein